MKLLLAAASAAALFALAGAASAQAVGPSLYGTLGYTQYHGNIEEPGFNEELNFGSVTGRFGGRLTPFVGAELEGSIGVREDRLDFAQGGVDGTMKLRAQAAVYAIGFVPVGANAELFGRVGWGSSNFDARVFSGGGNTGVNPQGVYPAPEGQSINYGFGGQFFFDGVNGLRADYTRHDFRDDDEALDSFTISYIRRF